MTHYDFDNRTRWRHAATLTQTRGVGGRWLLALRDDAFSPGLDFYAFGSKATAQKRAKQLLNVPRIHWRYMDGELQGFYLLRHEAMRRQLRLAA